MKTDDVLNLDCTKDENKKKLNRFLYNIKPIVKQMGEDKTKQIPLSVLEKTLHNISIKYGYRNQGVNDYYEKQEFKFYTVSIVKKADNSWIGNIYGKTLWETVAKQIIKIYADVLKERNEKNEK